MKNKTFLVTLITGTILLSIQFSSYSQVLISGSTGTPNSSAMLDIESTSKGLLIPRMTTAQRTGITTPAQGLLVFDTSVGGFFIYGKNYEGKLGWIDLSSDAGLWTKSGGTVYLTNSTYNVGVGTNAPASNFVVQANSGDALVTDVLFEVKDNLGNTIFEVTSGGVRAYVKKPTKGAKGISGGFAVGKYGAAKGLGDLLVVTEDSTRVYTDAAAGISGGFAVGKYGAAKGSTFKYFFTHSDSTRIYTDQVAKGISGGFAVGKYGAAKGKATRNNYLYMVPDNYFIGHQSGDSLQSGNFSGRYNTFFGYQTGLKDTAGGSNVFIGYKSGLNNTGQISGVDSLGFRNVFLGYESGFNNTLGSDNVLLGYKSGHEVTTAGNNISIGSSAGYNNTNNSDNIFIGREAGFNHTGNGTMNDAINNIFMGLQAGYGDTINGNQGSNNIFLGTESGKYNYTGSLNVFIGSSSGFSNTTGDANVFLGLYSGAYNTTGGQNTFLGTGCGNMNKTGGNNVFMGVNAGAYHDVGLSNVYIGNEAGKGTVSADFSTTYGRGFNNVFVGNQAGFVNTDGINNVFLGYRSGYSNTLGQSNVFIGNQAGRSNTGDNSNWILGSNNVFMGNSAGLNNTTGFSNVFIGNTAGQNNVDAYSNVFIGDQCGITNTTGSLNTFIGYRSGNSNLSSNSNTFVGESAGFSNSTANSNTYLGRSTGYKNNGSLNTFVGDAAGTFSENASENVFVGVNAGLYHVDGYWNVIIGNDAGRGEYLNASTSHSNTIIGNKAAMYSNNMQYNVLIGKDVMIGTDAIKSEGDYNTILGFQAGNKLTTGGGNVFLGYQAGFNETGSNKLYIDNSNTATPLIYGDFLTDALHINGTLTFNAGTNSVTLPTVRGTNGYVLTTDGVGGSSWTSASTLYDNDWIVSGVNMYSGVTGNVGVGEVAPSQKLDVGGEIELNASLYFRSGNLSVYNGDSRKVLDSWWSGGLGATGLNVGDYTAINSAYDWTTDEPSSIITSNVYPFLVTIGSAANPGVAYQNALMVMDNAGNLGIGTTTPAYKLHAVNTTATNDDAAVYGIHQVTDNYGTGVKGVGGFYGVYGEASGGTTGTRYGVYGIASGGTTNWAGYFAGNVNVTGTLSKGGGTFKIDHPLDPENKYLYHSFVESPDMMNIYNGNVILDNNGEAVVTMPDWFEALNMEFRYQLTAIGAPGPDLYIAEEIIKNKFKIAGGKSGIKVSWQVTGIRHDAFANKNRVKVEVDKNADEKGKYLYPDAFNQPKEKGIDFEMRKK